MELYRILVVFFCRIKSLWEDLNNGARYFDAVKYILRLSNDVRRDIANCVLLAKGVAGGYQSAAIN